MEDLPTKEADCLEQEPREPREPRGAKARPFGEPKAGIKLNGMGYQRDLVEDV